ncbi:MAG TPA: energy transducer TonB [Terracidiphilus sp.]|nr:energy transducer TonB [Terracidiphilus sp.]
MYRLCLAAALLIVCASPSTPPNDSAAQQLLDSAHSPANLLQGTSSPFDLEVDFTAQFKAPTVGHLTLKWQSKDHWWSKVEISGFEQTTVRDGEEQYILRNIPYTPVPISDLFNLLGLAGDPTSFTATKQKVRSRNGVAMACIQASEKRYLGTESREFCLDAHSRDMLSDSSEDFLRHKRIERYSDYFDFAGKRYPRRLDLLDNGKTSVAANVIQLQTAAFDSALLVAPEGSIRRKKCANMTPPVSIRRVDLPPSSLRRLPGNVLVSLTILTDGSVSNVQVIGNSAPQIDAEMVKALKQWKFRPAMCGQEPVVTDGQIVIDNKDGPN